MPDRLPGELPALCALEGMLHHWAWQSRRNQRGNTDWGTDGEIGAPCAVLALIGLAKQGNKLTEIAQPTRRDRVRGYKTLP
eukprot:scaffold113236_cov19-Prasinocladus_malaysianus.AAC.1